MTDTAPIGFIGLGTMGEPMALNLRKAGSPLVVWNRSPEKCERLAAAGAEVAADSNDVFSRCATVMMMLMDGEAIDAVLARGTQAFSTRVQGHVIVNLSTVEPAYSQALAEDIRAAGGRFVEAPVSGSRIPAEKGELVAMLSGAPEDVDAIGAQLAPMCRQHFACGPVPGALRMKLAVNTFLITMVTGLAEAARFASGHGLDMHRFAEILDAGPMCSAVSRVKVGKLRDNDLTKQASISDVLKNSDLVMNAAGLAGIAMPLMQVCRALYAKTESMGFGEQDMVAVVKAIENASHTS
ncbi:NAD(P)-dependent oxidoreductase [Pandoraea apista]|uniref:NAD(P)-dependent oxidoreductase n=1 Tax=Pandoraea apista TaxID=93218 RepID=UPI00058A94AE|nr:NAD(P)-dependent oxidoreductase [Pandoraea apista]AJE98985.1 2-hydroxy-3-oxopropionate reductase [Pandoraea apista]AKH73071.1 2-hydroxy-3-oxopropionate reductase [Pandoraea apista]AKI61456.1 2-hydroxy-3-oxopropionate reductase [Pandoraea apista]